MFWPENRHMAMGCHLKDEDRWRRQLPAVSVIPLSGQEEVGQIPGNWEDFFTGGFTWESLKELSPQAQCPRAPAVPETATSPSEHALQS